MRGLKRIEQMYAFVMVDPGDNTEGIPAVRGPSGELLPLLGADIQRVEALKPTVQREATRMGIPITLCRFEVRTELETFEP